MASKDDLLLSDREREIWLATREMTIDEAANKRGIAVSTVNTHLDRCYQKQKNIAETIEEAKDQIERRDGPGNGSKRARRVIPMSEEIWKTLERTQELLAKANQRITHLEKRNEHLEDDLTRESRKNNRQMHQLAELRERMAELEYQLEGDDDE